MFFSLFIFLFLTKINNIHSLNDKFCVNCRHFIKQGPLCDDKFGRCNLYPIKLDKYNEMNYLVSGKRKLEYRYCSFVREDEQACGPTAKYYNKKIVLFPRLKNLQRKLCNFTNDINNEELIDDEIGKEEEKNNL
jgi:hypothetical protein